MDQIIRLLAEQKVLVLTMHLLSVAIGMGGATITDLLFFDFLRDFRISRKEAGVMRTLSHLIMGAIVALWLSGIALFLSDIAKYSASAAFLAKSTIVVAITINGILLHKFITPHLIELSFIQANRSYPTITPRLRQVAFILGAVSFASWYSSFFVAMLKKTYLADFSYGQLMLGYLIIVMTGILVSLWLEKRLHRQSGGA